MCKFFYVFLRNFCLHSEGVRPVTDLNWCLKLDLSSIPRSLAIWETGTSGKSRSIFLASAMRGMIYGISGNSTSRVHSWSGPGPRGSCPSSSTSPGTCPPKPTGPAFSRPWPWISWWMPVHRSVSSYFSGCVSASSTDAAAEVFRCPCSYSQVFQESL